MLSFLCHHFLIRSLRYFEKHAVAKLVTLSLFLFVFCSLATGMYFFFASGFRFIAQDAFFSEALLLFTYELFLLISCLLVFASALISGMFLLFRREASPFLMASPHFWMMPSLIFARVFLTSLWPLLIMVLPALLAIRNVFRLAGAGFLLALVSIGALIATAVMSAMVLLFGVASVLLFLGRGQSGSVLSLKTFALSVSVVVVAILGWIWSRFRFVNLLDLFQAGSVNIPAPDISPILHQFSMVPSHFSVLTIFFSQRAEWGAALSNVLYLVLVMIAVSLLFYFFQRKYLLFWQLFQEGRFVASTRASRVFHGRALWLGYASGPGSAIFLKESATFIRDVRGVLWFGFILLLWLIQTATNAIVFHSFALERTAAPAFPAAMGILEFGVIIYFVGMLVLRFAFPSFSTERRSAWILASAPIDLGNVFLAKLLFFASLFSIFGVVSTFLNVSISRLSFPVGVICVSGVILAVAAITAFGLGLGAIFPNFETDDPEALSTTIPGLAFILGALLYGIFGAIAIQNILLKGISSLFIIFSVFSLCFIWLFSRLSRRALRRLEF